jgi:chromosome segregation ATPase
MATMPAATVKKPRTNVETIPQLSTLPERVTALEVKVENIDEKLDFLKEDVKEMHDCLDRTREGIMVQLEKMHEASNDQHKELANKISELEKFKNKGTLYIMLLLAFGAGSGWVSQVNIPLLLKFLGL